MEVRHFTIHQVTGINGLPGNSDVELLRDAKQRAHAFLTVRKEEYFLHLKRMHCLGVITAQQITVPGAPLPNGSYQDRFRAAMTTARVNQPGPRSPILVIEVEGSVDDLDEKLSPDLGDFGMTVQDIGANSLDRVASKALNAAHAGLSLALHESVTDDLRRLGAFTYAIEPIKSRIVYSLSIKASAFMTTSARLDANTAASAAHIAKSVNTSAQLDNIARLLSLSSAQIENPLMAFMSAWTGLELFVHQVFKSEYEPEIMKMLAASLPPSSSSFVERLRKVMDGKYNIRDKFIAVASALNAADAETDIETFSLLKKQRDDFTHTMSADPLTLPDDTARAVLRKYLKLHLARHSAS